MRIDAIEQRNILIGWCGGAAAVALANVVVLIRQPNMQIIHIRVGLRILNDRFFKSAPGVRFRVAQICVGRYAVPIFPAPVNFGEKATDRSGRFLPAPDTSMMKTDRLAGPSVASTVLQEPAAGNSAVNFLIYLLFSAVAKSLRR